MTNSHLDWISYRQV